MRKNKPPHLMRAFFTAAAIIITASSSHAALTAQLGILDLTANGGINPATGAAWQNGDTYRLAFVTGGTTAATSSDISTYNSFVQTAANNSTTFSNLGDVTWKVMGSTATVNAKVNTDTDSGTGGATFLLNGTSVFATNYADLWDNAGSNRIGRTENNVVRQGNLPDTPIWGSWTAVWTGNNGDGTTNADPLGGDAGGNVSHGLMQAEVQFWQRRSSSTSSTLLPVYALSETLTVVPEPSSTVLLGLGGLGLILRRRR